MLSVHSDLEEDQSLSPRAVEDFAQRIEAMGFALEGLRLPDRRNPDAFHEHKSELKREWRKIAVDFRNSFGAPQARGGKALVDRVFPNS